MNSDNKIFLIINDRKKGLSFGQFANKYAISRSTVQYMIRIFRKQHKKRGSKEKITKKDKCKQY